MGNYWWAVLSKAFWDSVSLVLRKSQIAVRCCARHGGYGDLGSNIPRSRCFHGAHESQRPLEKIITIMKNPQQ